MEKNKKNLFLKINNRITVKSKEIVSVSVVEIQFNELSLNRVEKFNIEVTASNGEKFTIYEHPVTEGKAEAVAGEILELINAEVIEL